MKVSTVESVLDQFDTFLCFSQKEEFPWAENIFITDCVITFLQILFSEQLYIEVLTIVFRDDCVRIQWNSQWFTMVSWVNIVIIHGHMTVGWPLI